MEILYLAHHGILGQKWGVRRFQNEDGSLTEAGRKRYLDSEGHINGEGIRVLNSRPDTEKVISTHLRAQRAFGFMDNDKDLKEAARNKKEYDSLTDYQKAQVSHAFRSTMVAKNYLDEYLSKEPGNELVKSLLNDYRGDINSPGRFAIAPGKDFVKTSLKSPIVQTIYNYEISMEMGFNRKD